ncbi:hypothetical protein ERO13_D07G176900v2 [Gossypium hirsutum]|uniref:Uncharacterized protein n=2 Tax=Gossypium TaxID=3633 RepID=A0A5D2K8X7_GOSTO|nr:uncharacterized protein LOC105800428 isoform X3 [Gossypium raimondii]KAG4139208.1 hypothetical protein ERO13_D07G176900v2 [Gossypium hirsutum]TYH63621.1 hypothetical protein ES332_D07G205300v1 [Gossypium tomentosum]
MLRFKERRWDSKRMIDSGGMPSSHSATVTALAVAIGLQDGMGGPAFAIAVVLACVEYCWWQSLLSIFFSLTFLFPLIDAMAIDLTTSASMSLTMLISMVMYDASGVRLHAGRQAELLNQIVCEFPPEHPLSSVRPLRELLGHTPLQVVAGALVGFIVAFLMRNSG